MGWWNVWKCLEPGATLTPAHTVAQDPSLEPGATLTPAHSVAQDPSLEPGATRAPAYARGPGPHCVWPEGLRPALSLGEAVRSQLDPRVGTHVRRVGGGEQPAALPPLTGPGSPGRRIGRRRQSGLRGFGGCPRGRWASGPRCSRSGSGTILGRLSQRTSRPGRSSHHLCCYTAGCGLGSARPPRLPTPRSESCRVTACQDLSGRGTLTSLKPTLFWPPGRPSLWRRIPRSR